MKSYPWALFAGLLLLQGACTKTSPEPDLLRPATIKDIMDSMVDPSGDFLFESVQEIADDRGVTKKAPKTDAEWDAVRQRLFVLVEAGNLMAMQGRQAARTQDRSKNPKVEKQPEEIQKLMDASRPDFLRRTRSLQDAAMTAMKAADAKDTDALFAAIGGVDTACESCHLQYWYPPAK
jgi:hypothetical protein